LDDDADPRRPTPIGDSPSNREVNADGKIVWHTARAAPCRFEAAIKPFMNLLAVCLTLTLTVPRAIAQDNSVPPNIAGKWVLDFSRTKNPPAGLQDYTLAVKLDAQQISVETALVGNLQAAPGAVTPNGMGGNSGRAGGMAPAVRRGMGIPRDGSAMPGGVGGGPRGEGPLQGNLAAYQVYPQNVVYKLDGSEAASQFSDEERTPATAKMERPGHEQILKLSLTGKSEAGEKNSQIKVKDLWQLSEDGKYLKLDRTIKSPEGSGTVHMIFCRPEERAAREKEADSP